MTRWALTVRAADGSLEPYDPTDFPDPPPPDDPWHGLSLDRDTVAQQLAGLPPEWRPTLPPPDAGPA